LPIVLADPLRYPAYPVDMTLNEVSTESVSEPEGALKIDPIAGTQFAKARTMERLRPGLESAGIGIVFDHRQADPVDRNTFADREFRAKLWSGNHEVPSRTFRLEATNRTHHFNQTGKHQDSSALQPTASQASALDCIAVDPKSQSGVDPDHCQGLPIVISVRPRGRFDQ
jgi:hypothetical protein